MSEDIASLVGDILSDPGAREKEFGRDSVLNFPYQTAVKTGTSSDYRDAWSIGFNDKYTVGIWMGNLDYTEMNEVTGSLGPALVLRSVFNELNKNREVSPLYFSKNLIKHRVCIKNGLPAHEECESRDEWFVAGTEPNGAEVSPDNLRIRKPGKGLMLAMDPRIPDESEYFEFALTAIDNLKSVSWFVNDRLVAITEKSTYHWKLSKGRFSVRAEIVFSDSQQPVVTEIVEFLVN